MIRFDVISVHFTNDCNLQCPMCYKQDLADQTQKPFSHFLQLVPYLGKLTKQVALGGSEPLLYPDFVRAFSKYCHEHNMICNMTTNGTLISKLAECAEDLTMVSLSFDKYKVISLGAYIKKIKVTKDLDVLVGSNILLDAYLLADLKKFLRLIDIILNHADFIYLLSPKLYGFLGIHPYTDFFYAISILYQGRVFFENIPKRSCRNRATTGLLRANMEKVSLI